MEPPENQEKPVPSGAATPRSEAKARDRERLASALRENLQRRKTQKRARLAPDAGRGEVTQDGPLEPQR